MNKRTVTALNRTIARNVDGRSIAPDAFEDAAARRIVRTEYAPTTLRAQALGRAQAAPASAPQAPASAPPPGALFTARTVAPTSAKARKPSRGKRVDAGNAWQLSLFSHFAEASQTLKALALDGTKAAPLADSEVPF